MGEFSGLQIGLLGFGRWGQVITRDLVKLGIRPLVADPATGFGSNAEELGVGTLVRHWSEFPDEVDAYIVATPASTHAAVVDELATTGKPLFVEKPMALTREDAVSMATAAGDRMFIMHIWRYHPAIQLLKSVAQSGDIGDLCWLRSGRQNWTSPRTDCDPVWTLLPHDITIFLEITGEMPEPKYAVAEWLDEKPVGLLASLGDAPNCIAEVSTRYGDKRRETRVHGTKGIAVMPVDKPEILLYRGDGMSSIPEPEVIRARTEKSALQLELETYLTYLNGGDLPRSSLEEALHTNATMLRLRELANL